MLNDGVRKEAERRVMEDLLNAMLAEGLLQGLQAISTDGIVAVADADTVAAGAWKLLKESGTELERKEASSGVEATDGRGDAAEEAQSGLFGLWRTTGGITVMFGLRRSQVQRFRCEASAIVAANDSEGRTRLLSAPELMRMVGSSLIQAGEARPEGTETFIDMLWQTIDQTAWALEQPVSNTELLRAPQAIALLRLERLGALRDRPFHPVAKVKLGWSYDECGFYAAESASPLQLRWMAVRRDRLLISEGAKGSRPESLLLSVDEQAELERELARRGLKEHYMAVPVHPWQMESILPHRLKPELAEGACVPLKAAVGTYYPTSSVRSLMSFDNSHMHVKLPLGIRSLGGLRYLSAIKLMNGTLAETLLRKAIQLDSVLREKLHLCEESCWWALAPHDNDLFADDPRHLSAMVRVYPQELVGDPETRLVPMSALAAHGDSCALFEEWLRQRGMRNEAQEAMELFREIAGVFGELSLRLLRCGLVPEVHGQNTVLVVKDGCVQGLLLRDHDALRVHVPWLLEAGLEDPGYRLRPRVPNSLYHDSPQQLIAFFQMLGIQINLFAVMDSISNAYGIPEERMWENLREVLLLALERSELPQTQREAIYACLFTDHSWPWKQVVRPLLAQSAKVPGSMPYGKGEMPNPLVAAELREEASYASH
ncbi:IucA/IucC family protein [Paenibacillus lautus]|uniref:IucA/IucC family protein n=1 Tax=Paenibacillus lautus TaxID=1401 RepID=UPI001C7D57A4|nr:IucA/IucC family protein [Paenibacillus lautus]MBX4149097.1 hypothetical protein [Paenibacillus lautus]